MTNLEEWANYAYEVAQHAGQAIMAIYQQIEAVIPLYKEDNSPLTVADQQSHEIISNALSQYKLDEQGVAPVLSEEGRDIPFLERQQWHRYWCVDPLDGTKDFLAQNDEFTINIALIEAHQPIIGVVYVPARKVGYLAWKGGGAYEYQGQSKSRISTRIPPSKPLKVLVSRYHGLESLQSWLSALGEVEIVHQGSALKFCVLAKGEADLFLRLSPSSEWDNAAGQCILEQAGGDVFTWDQQPLPYNRTGILEQRRFIAVGDPNSPWQKYFIR